MQVEGVDEALVESDELQSKFDFVGDVGNALAEAHTYGLLHPQHALEDISIARSHRRYASLLGQVRPRVRVLHRRQGASFPSEGTVLGQKTTEGRAARATIEPDGNLLVGGRVAGREEPEKQFAGLVRRGRDGQQASIGLSNIEVDIRNSRAIDNKFCIPVSTLRLLMSEVTTYSRSRCLGTVRRASEDAGSGK